jgi:hypothetical protein
LIKQLSKTPIMHTTKGEYTNAKMGEGYVCHLPF